MKCNRQFHKYWRFFLTLPRFPILVMICAGKATLENQCAYTNAARKVTVRQGCGRLRHPRISFSAVFILNTLEYAYFGASLGRRAIPECPCSFMLRYTIILSGAAEVQPPLRRKLGFRESVPLQILIGVRWDSKKKSNRAKRRRTRQMRTILVRMRRKAAGFARSRPAIHYCRVGPN